MIVRVEMVVSIVGVTLIVRVEMVVSIVSIVSIVGVTPYTPTPGDQGYPNRGGIAPMARRDDCRDSRDCAGRDGYRGHGLLAYRVPIQPA
jgi:hypothetical protein